MKGPRPERPPRLAESLLSLRLDRESREFALGDLAEEFVEQSAERGPLWARAWYWGYALRTLLTGDVPADTGMGDPTPHDPRQRPARRLGGSFIQDARYAFRSLGRAPLFTGAAILTLALGVGATATVFSFADAMVFRPIPGIEAPQEVADVRGCYPGRRADSCVVTGLSYPNFADVASRLRTASGLAGQISAGSAEIIVGDAEPRTVSPRYVSASFFDVLGARPQIGRVFTLEEATPGSGAAVAVISDRLWTIAFDRGRDVLGESILVNGKVFDVVGVAAPGFHGTTRGRDDLWLPASSMLFVNGWTGDLTSRTNGTGDFAYLLVRRNPGTSWEEVRAELNSFSDWLAEQYPEANAKFEQVRFRVTPGLGSANAEVVALAVASGAVVALILLIACANVSSLLLVQGLRRRGETAVRKALGAGTWRLIRQNLTESVILWMLGAALGTGLASGLIRAADLGIPELAGLLHVDGRVLGFVGAVTLVAGIGFGALPAIAVARIDAARWLGQGGSHTTNSRGRVRRTLSALQLGATLALLVAALLTNRSLQALADVDLGFNPSGVMTFEVRPGTSRYNDAGRQEYYRDVLARLRADPVIEAAAVAVQMPFVDGGIHSAMRRVDAEEEPLRVLFTEVDPGYFNTLQIPLRAGRTFTEAEYSSTAPDSVVILGASTARMVFGDADPLGELVVMPVGDQVGPRYRVVGIAADARFSRSSLSGDHDPMVYRPFGARGRVPGTAGFMVRSRASAGEIAPLIRGALSAIDEDVRAIGLVAHDEAVSRFFAPVALIAQMTAWIAVAASVLAAVGLYGVVGVAADQRMREFGIRVALGADSRKLLGEVVRESVGVVLAGLVVGAVASLALGTGIASFLVGVTPFDPLSWVVAAGLLGLVAMLAIFGPARRAVSLDPIEVLREG